MAKQSATTAKQTDKAKADTPQQPQKRRGGQRKGMNAKSRDNAKGDGNGMAEGSPTIIAQRRELVATYRLRGATISQIEAALIEEGCMNPSRKKPWSRGVLFDDLDVIRNEWRERAAEKIEVHFSQIFAELEELKRDAWANKDRATVLRAISQQCKMFGFNAPVKVQITQQTQPGEVQPELVLTDMNVDQLRVLYDVYTQLMAQGKEPMTVAATLVSSTPVAVT